MDISDVTGSTLLVSRRRNGEGRKGYGPKVGETVLCDIPHLVMLKKES